MAAFSLPVLRACNVFAQEGIMVVSVDPVDPVPQKSQ